MTPKEYYKTYQADNARGALNHRLIELIKAEKPGHVFEFGAGTGKNLALLDCVTCGLDISILNVLHAHFRNNLPFVILGDESHLGFFGGFDVVFTCSVLDHIELVGKIIENFKRMARYAVFLAETNENPGDHYYPHDYESYGFVRKDFAWTGDDGATYHIWEWRPEWK